ncbi:hypothetical protein G6F22_019420 [Rhizopus arrhizus]|nr:hypothetical protein G6F22_019420 [Rhizopus arrhizus]
MPSRLDSSFSSFSAWAWVERSDAPSASSMSTISSGRVESGKNCCGRRRGSDGSCGRTGAGTGHGRARAAAVRSGWPAPGSGRPTAAAWHASARTGCPAWAAAD